MLTGVLPLALLQRPKSTGDERQTLLVGFSGSDGHSFNRRDTKWLRAIPADLSKDITEPAMLHGCIDRGVPTKHCRRTPSTDHGKRDFIERRRYPAAAAHLSQLPRLFRKRMDWRAHLSALQGQFHLAQRRAEDVAEP